MPKVLMFIAVVGMTLAGGCKWNGKGGNEAKAREKGGGKAAASSHSGKSNHDKFQGTWDKNIDKMVEWNPKLREEAAANPALLPALKKWQDGTTYTVTKGSLIVRWPGRDGKTDREEKSTYVVKAQEGNKLVMDFTGEGGTVTVTATLENDDTCILREGDDENSIVLTRKK